MVANCFFVCTGQLLDILSPVKVTASSTYTEPSSGLQFAPQLAVQADSGYLWANCFLSNMESNPWFQLELKSLTSIFNVRLGVRDKGSARLPDIFPINMNTLSVYVTKSSSLQTPC